MAPRKNHYQFLGLEMSAQLEQIEAAVELLTKQAHTLAYTAPSRSQELRERIWQIKEDLLSGAEARVAYDQSILHPRKRTAPPEPPREDEPRPVRPSAELPELRPDRSPQPPSEPEEQPSLLSLLHPDWASAMPRPLIIDDVRQIVRRFQQAVDYHDAQVAEASQRYRARKTKDSASRISREQLDDQLASLQTARDLLQSVSLSPAILARWVDGVVPTEDPDCDPADALHRAAAAAHSAATKVRRITSNPLFRLNRWLLWLLVALFEFAILSIGLMYTVPQQAILLEGLGTAAIVAILTIVRLSQWMRLRDTCVALAHASADGLYFHTRALARLEERKDESAWSETTYQQDKQDADSALNEAIAQLAERAETVHTQLGLLDAPWDDARWQEWVPTRGVGPVARIGALVLAAADRTLRLPALLPFPGAYNLSLHASARTPPALDLLASVSLRFLTLVPPGSLDILVIDPAGTDMQKRLGPCTVWSDAPGVATGLSRLWQDTSGMVETLRTRRQTFEDYQSEVKNLPYRLLIVTGMPQPLSETTALQLLDIATIGPACGVYTLLCLDPRVALPAGLQRQDLERSATILTWDGRSFTWQDPDFSQASFGADPPPSPEVSARIVTATHAPLPFPPEPASDTFATHAPDPAATWATPSSLIVPLGMAGKEPVDLPLTAQNPHAFLTGRPGSIMTAFTRALLAGLCLAAAPRDLSLYLLDLTDGDLLHPFAAHDEPHVAVLATASSPEFALSVLQRLHEELNRRQADATGAEANIVLFLHGLHHVLGQDDSTAQEFAVLLDRLAAQGGDANLHLLLSSSHMARTYTRVRATLDRIGTRIGLSCVDADARLFFDGRATEPGEALLRSLDGAFAPFRPLTIGEAEMAGTVTRLHALAVQCDMLPPVPTIRFSGDSLADITRNLRLHNILVTPSAAPTVPLAFLGDPEALAEPIAAPVRTRPGSHLLIVGSEAPAALGVLGAALISLVAARRTEAPLVTILDCAGDRSYWERLAHTLGSGVEVRSSRSLRQVLANVAADVQQRMVTRHTEPMRYLVLSGLSDAQASLHDAPEAAADIPARHLLRILREGPELGVHVLAWFDHPASLEGALDRRALREFDMRVVFRLDAEDSRALIERTRAAQLHPHQAIFYSEEDHRLEVFRPYGLASEEWLAFVRNHLQGAANPVQST